VTAPVTIALYGGSFDPPHLAHQMACLYALSVEGVDQVWLVPTFRHAFGKDLSPFADRVRMCELAATPFGERVKVTTVEEELAAEGRENRTFHTVVHLEQRHPGHRFRLLVGEDILAERDAWHRWDDLVARAPLLVVGRAGLEPLAGVAAGEEPAVRLPAISSTALRARLRAGQAVVALLPRAVMDYIAQRGLYR
jgi:nicotinate-nucleotide adenylyltransferase